MSKPHQHADGHAGSKYRLGYRPEIEGLRAVAMLLVVAAHAGAPGFAGGFVGVDIFFVLSGYLITGLLLQEVHATGTVALARFYARRLLRLMPALLLMIGVTGVLGWLLLPAVEQSTQAVAATAAALWLSNVHFAFQGMDYFSPGSERNLFLHTWSLGVEEQFYIIWPLLFILTLCLWQRAESKPRLIALNRTLWLALAASFALGLYWAYTTPTLAFYMMPSRAWQFSLGALVFMHFGAPAFQPREAPRKKTYSSWPAGWTGLGMIAAATLLLDKSTPYPGLWALLPSIGTALILLPARHASPNAVHRWLALPPMQAIGRISYSWYLWHWPVLLLGAAVVDIYSAWNRAALVLLSLSIAAASWRYFEAPLRRQRQLVAKPRMAIFVSLGLMIASGSLALRWGTSADTRSQSPEHLRFQAARTDAPEIYAMGCDDWYQSAEVRICSFGNKTAPRTAVAMGDSIGLQWFPAYAKVFAPPDWRLLVITKSACPMVDIPIFYPRIGRMYTECAEWRDSALEEVVTISPDILVLGSTHTYDYTPAQWEQGTRQVLQRVADSTELILVMRSTPTLSFDGPSCLEPRSNLHERLNTGNACIGPAYSTRGQNVLVALEKAIVPFQNARLLDLTKEVCPEGVCNAQVDGDAVFRDTQHLTSSFAESLANELASLVFQDEAGEDPAR